MNAKDYDAEWKWMTSSPEAKRRSDAALKDALKMHQDGGFPAQLSLPSDTK